MVQGGRIVIQIAVCDDEDGFLFLETKFIQAYMKKYGYQCQVDTFSSGIDFIKLDNNNEMKEYDIIFLDINMEKMDGIETAKHLREVGCKSYLVFVTAFINYALEGYKVDATRYLLKESDSLEQSMDECLDTIMQKMNYKENRETFAFLEGEKTILLDEIVYVESNLHKLTFYLASPNSKDYSMYEKLDTIDDKLHSYGFCRIHKSYLVNLKYVQGIERYSVQLNEGICNLSSLSVSQARYDTAKEQYIFYQGEV